MLPLAFINISLTKKQIDIGKQNIQWFYHIFLYHKSKGFQRRIYAVEESVNGIGNMQEHGSSE